MKEAPCGPKVNPNHWRIRTHPTNIKETKGIYFFSSSKDSKYFTGFNHSFKFFISNYFRLMMNA
jgi:hypothetical protein